MTLEHHGAGGEALVPLGHDPLGGGRVSAHAVGQRRALGPAPVTVAWVAGAPGLDLYGGTIDHHADFGNAAGVVVDVDPGAFELIKVVFNRQQGQQREQRQEWVGLDDRRDAHRHPLQGVAVESVGAAILEVGGVFDDQLVTVQVGADQRGGVGLVVARHDPLGGQRRGADRGSQRHGRDFTPVTVVGVAGAPGVQGRVDALTADHHLGDAAGAVVDVDPGAAKVVQTGLGGSGEKQTSNGTRCGHRDFAEQRRDFHDVILRKTFERGGKVVSRG